jgi:hypothetical protein
MLSTVFSLCQCNIFYNNNKIYPIIVKSNTIINNNDDERLQDPILLLKILMFIRKFFSEYYVGIQFGHALTKQVASPDHGDIRHIPLHISCLLIYPFPDLHFYSILCSLIT